MPNDETVRLATLDQGTPVDTFFEPSLRALGDLDDFGDFDAMAQFSGVAGDVLDPYPDLWDKRANHPVERIDTTSWKGDPVVQYTVYPFDLVSQVMRDNETFSSRAVRETMGLVMGDTLLVGLDEPEHRRQRALVSPAFRAKTLARWETTLLDTVIDELIDRFAARGSAELVRELTFRFPVQVIGEILGIPRADYPRFLRWALAITNLVADPMTGFAAAQSLREYLKPLIDARRADPRDDVISDLVTVELPDEHGNPERLSDEEINSFLCLLLPAGAETTYRASGNLLFGLLTHPDQLDALRADRGLIPQAVEEGLRWENPLTITIRRCERDTELAGVPIEAGADVITHLGAANHDPTYWDHPDEFDIHRPQRQAAVFGFGPHMCLGMHLARLEIRSVVGHLLDRLPDLRLDPVAGRDAHIHGERFRSPTALPVLFS
jgi:cytochrome P450